MLDDELIAGLKIKSRNAFDFYSTIFFTNNKDLI
jgi:hypothetical protein